MEELVKNLPATDYFRISRSFIISYKSIEVIHIQDRNRLKVLLSPAFKEDVFVSREKVTEFKEWIGE
jgi:DNA-binding LytR/AlgR family response regulator